MRRLDCVVALEDEKEVDWLQGSSMWPAMAGSFSVWGHVGGGLGLTLEFLAPPLSDG